MQVWQVAVHSLLIQIARSPARRRFFRFITALRICQLAFASHRQLYVCLCVCGLSIICWSCSVGNETVYSQFRRPVYTAMCSPIHITHSRPVTLISRHFIARILITFSEGQKVEVEVKAETEICASRPVYPWCFDITVCIQNSIKLRIGLLQTQKKQHARQSSGTESEWVEPTRKQSYLYLCIVA